jgi:hypothetical protein
VTRIYDKLDWHAQAAVEAGEPLENAFTHIGLFLTWLIRHDLHDTMLIHAEWADAVKAGEMTGSDLASALDEALVADAMTDDGRHFADSYYDTYLSDYDTCFKGSAPYSIPDDSASYARIAPAIDRAYAAWVDSGRPAPQVSEPKDNSELGGEPGEFEGEIGMLVSDIPDPHESRELEALIPADLTDSPMRVSSVRGTYWGDSLLNQALRRLGMRPADCLIANGIAGEGPDVVTITLYSVPAAPASQLDSEFQNVIHRPTREPWQLRELGGHRVHFATGLDFCASFWANDGLVVHVSASTPHRLEAVALKMASLLA